MNKKKFISTGIFIAVVAIGAGVACYCYPSAINNALGINSAGIDTISDGDLLAADSASSSLAAIDPDAGSDGAAAQTPAPSSSLAKKSAAHASSGVAAVPTVEDDNSGDSVMAQASSSLSSLVVSPIPAAPCVFPACAPAPSTTRKIIFNEIAWMGSPSSSTAEWMEIKNILPAAVNLSGWELFDASGKIKISFSESDGALAPGGLFLLSRGAATPTGAIGATKIYSGDLANTGDTLALMDPRCNVSDYLDASDGWPAGNNTTKQTLERDANGVGWHTSAQPGGTPGAENSAGPAATTTMSTTPVPMPTPVPAPTPQNVVPAEDGAVSSGSDVATSTSVTTSSSSIDVDAINTQSTTTTSTESDSDNSASADSNATTTPAAPDHVLIAAVQIAGASSSNDLVKLYNPTATAIDMSGWKLHKKSSTGTDYSLKVFPAGSMIGAGQSFVWANSDDGFSEMAGANVSSTETLAADNSVALMDAAGTIVDAVAWGTGANQYGEGPPYPTSPGANQLLSRRSSDGVMADTGNNSNDFTIQ